MLHDHIKIIKCSLTVISFVRGFPIEWDDSAKRVVNVKTRGRLIIPKIVQILQLWTLGLITVVVYSQHKAGCVYTMLPNIFMWLVAVTLCLWGMGIQLAKKAGVLLNTMIDFEKWLQDTFPEIDIIERKKILDKSITSR